MGAISESLPRDFQAGEYDAVRASFHKAVGELVRLSTTLRGAPSENGRQYWSSVLAAKMALTSMTLDKIVPRHASTQSRDLWDIGSVAALVRVLAENYLIFHWLCVETETEELWKFRITVLTIADNRARYRLAQENESEPEPVEFVKAQAKLAELLTAMAMFQALPQRCQTELLKGTKSPFVQDEVVDCLEINRDTFRKLYRYLSSFVHTGPVSFFRVEEHGRGNGEYNEYEATMVFACLHFMVDLLQAAVRNLNKLH